MTVIFFTRLFYPHVGGVEKHILEVGRRLVGRGHRVIVVTEELSNANILVYQLEAPSAKTAENYNGLEVYRISVGGQDWFKKFRIWRQLWLKRKFFKDADLVHCHDVFFWYLPFRLLYPKKPIFTTFHGYETVFPPAKKAVLIRKISEKLSWGNICVGNYIKKWYGTKSDYITYGGVEIPNPKFKIQNKFKTQNSKYKIVFVGRLEEDTGVSVYLKTLRLLKTKKINFEFEAVGDGSLHFRVAQYGRVLGFVEGVSEYIENADIVFASSYLSILEALAYKKPVFAVYNNSLKKDYLETAPFAKFIIIKDDAQKLAEQIVYDLNHKKKIEPKISQGFEWVKGQTWDNVVDLYLRLWRHSGVSK
ncbi:glycosyltransferase family 4 protein [Patescibacteria group bacterium]|nr:glycosyltransferase family 4 protein [Patescibacteria group bacterium]